MGTVVSLYCRGVSAGLSMNIKRHRCTKWFYKIEPQHFSITYGLAQLPPVDQKSPPDVRAMSIAVSLYCLGNDNRRKTCACSIRRNLLF